FILNLTIKGLMVSYHHNEECDRVYNDNGVDTLTLSTKTHTHTHIHTLSDWTNRHISIGC
ncbi:hypothetical protein RDWZM_002895, partial [Blomia tropicalis]